MNTVLWISQIAMAIAFLWSGICKSLLPKTKLMAMGQTGIEELDPSFIKFIGLSEIVGAAALILPMLLNFLVWLTPLSALCLAFIMPLAAAIHYKKRESRNIIINFLFFIICSFIVYGRALI